MQRGTLSQRMREARLRLDPLLSQEEAGRIVSQKIGRARAYTAANVGHWESGKHQPPNDVVRAWSELTGAPVDWLMTGLVIKEAETGAANFVPRGGRAVPKITTDQAIQLPIDYQPVRTTYSHYPCSDKAFEIDVFDTRNTPEYQPGDALIIDAAEVARPGDMVLAVVGELPVFGRYERREGGVERIAAINGVWDTVVIDPTRGDRIVGVMTEHAKPRRQS